MVITATQVLGGLISIFMGHFLKGAVGVAIASALLVAPALIAAIANELESGIRLLLVRERLLSRVVHCPRRHHRIREAGWTG